MSLHYDFPYITNFSEIEHLVNGNENFIVAEKEGYKVVNYVRSGKDTFPIVQSEDDAKLREFRGIIFCAETGNILARRFHKFFNLGEREDVMTVDLSKPHVIMEKLDGSMITPFYLNKTVRWGTKMGLTEVSAQAEAFLQNKLNYYSFAKHCMHSDATPIFEWTSRKQRIVVDYPEDNLTLLAVRRNDTGRYVSREGLKAYSDFWRIPLVKVIASGTTQSQEEMVNHIRSLQGIEGFVIQFDDGHMVKIKTDEYVSLHRAKSLLENERDVVGLVLDEKTDDLYPLLPEADRERLQRFDSDLLIDVIHFNMKVNTQMNIIRHQGLTRKEFALASEKEGMDLTMRSMIFSHWGEDGCPLDTVKNYIKKNLGSRAAYAKCSSIIKTARWKEVKIDD